MKTLGALRRRLTYANVLATLALFFALTGASMAGVKYVANGDPAGGDLTGAYPNPTIAAGAVTSDKFALTATAPRALDSDALDGLDSTAFGGPTNLFISKQIFLEHLCGCSEGVTVASKVVPPGQYLVVGHASFFNTRSIFDQDGRCDLIGLKPDRDSGAPHEIVAVPTADQNGLTLFDTHADTVSRTIELVCFGDPTVDVFRGTLVALPVDSSN